MFGLAGSTPKATAGRPSVTKLIHRRWIGNNGRGQPSRIEKKIIMTSIAFADNK